MVDLSTLRVRTNPAGVSLDIRVQPRASRSAVTGVRDGALCVALHAPPVEGQANAALIALLSDVLRVPRRALSIIHGDKGRSKTVTVAGITHEQLVQALQSAAH